MHPFSNGSFRARIALLVRSFALGVLPILALFLLPACNGSHGSDEGSGRQPGEECPKPDGSGSFFVDEHEGGRASRIRLVEMVWGRLVDVHDVDEFGEARVTPCFRDFVINENVQSDGVNFDLITNPITQKTRLVILRNRHAAGGEFDLLLRQAARDLPPIHPRPDDGSGAGPFSMVTRNAVVVLRFDDLLDDGDPARADLAETVRVLTGYPPTVPFAPRLRFDANHGGIAEGDFHSTRVLIDATISAAEAATMPVPASINPIGFPGSEPGLTLPNVSVRIPTRLDFGSGCFKILRGLKGASVANTANGPVDLSSSTLDVVRAMRAGSTADPNRGFLLDLDPPRVLGAWAFQIEAAEPDPTGEPGFDFVLTGTFATVCRRAPRPGDTLEVGTRYLEVVEAASMSAEGEVQNLRVRLLADEPLAAGSAILGIGLFITPHDPSAAVEPGCWVTFTRPPGTYPASAISPQAHLALRFSEPMDPMSITPYSSMMLVRGDSSSTPSATSIVVGDVFAAYDLRTFTFTHELPLAHSGNGDPYHLLVDNRAQGVCDLGGNALRDPFPAIEFDIDRDVDPVANGGFVLRFDSVDEVEPVGPPSDPIHDLRGQFFYDLARGVIKPRPVTFSSEPVDRWNPIPGIMTPFAPGVQTPLSPLGSKLQTVWRYCDLGWQCEDETKFDLDVIGLNWSPVGGQVVSDYYEEFEIRLAHSNRLPDEDLDPNKMPQWPNSGLLAPPARFADNILVDPRSPQKVVHNRALGYRIDPIDLFLTGQGTPLMPFPLNRNPSAPRELFTWRDTSVLATGGAGGTGILLDIECGLPLFLNPGLPGQVAGAGAVPSFGLPLLMEYRCYPSDSGIGMNSLDIALACNSSPRPNFRAFSTGGLDTASRPISKNPDLELVPSGGFNPRSVPPGQPTPPVDCSFYYGQLDTVTRVSRAHSIWIDTLVDSPGYLPPIVLPRGDDQPHGTSVVVEFRGANQFSGITGIDPFDARQLDPYGELKNPGTVHFVRPDNTWVSDIGEVDGARYLQLRFSFFNDIDSGLSPVCSAVGVAYRDE